MVTYIVAISKHVCSIFMESIGWECVRVVVASVSELKFAPSIKRRCKFFLFPIRQNYAIINKMHRFRKVCLDFFKGEKDETIRKR